MTRLPLVFVRHGQTDWNAAGRLQGQTDVPLNARGRDQAASVGRALRKAFPDIGDRAFVASPLMRARDTMSVMRRAMGLDPDDFTMDDRLKEMTFGRWEGLTFSEVRRQEPEEALAREAARWTHRPPEGESYADLVDRVADFLASLDRETVVVSHGGVARAVMSMMTTLASEKLAELKIPQGRAVVFDDRRWRWI